MKVKGSIWSTSMHTPATRIRAPDGAAWASAWTTPGAPTHSKISGFLTVRPWAAAIRPMAPRGRHIELGPGGVGRDLGRVDDLVGAHAFGGGAALGGVVAGDDRPKAPGPERGDHRQAHRAAAHHHAHVVGGRLGLGHGVLAHGQGFGQGGVFGREAVGDLQHQGFGEDDVFGEAAGDAAGIAHRLEAGLGDDARDRDHLGAGLEAATGVRSVLDHLAAEFVTKDGVGPLLHGPAATQPRRHVDHVIVVIQGVQVGPADAADERAAQNLAGFRVGNSHVVHHQGAAAPDHRSHGLFLPRMLDRS